MSGVCKATPARRCAAASTSRAVGKRIFDDCAIAETVAPPRGIRQGHSARYFSCFRSRQSAGKQRSRNTRNRGAWAFLCSVGRYVWSPELVIELDESFKGFHLRARRHGSKSERRAGAGHG